MAYVSLRYIYISHWPFEILVLQIIVLDIDTMGSNGSKLKEDEEKINALNTELAEIKAKEAGMAEALKQMQQQEASYGNEMRRLETTTQILRRYLSANDYALVQQRLIELIAKDSKDGSILVKDLASKFLRDSAKLKKQIETEINNKSPVQFGQSDNLAQGDDAGDAD